MIIDRLTEDMKAAMKAGDKTRLGTIRMLMSELKNAKIAKGDDLDEAEEEKILASYAKKRKESIAVKLYRFDRKDTASSVATNMFAFACCAARVFENLKL